MTELLSDKLNLMLLKEICSGNGLGINITYLTKQLNRHRKTIRGKVEKLLLKKIIGHPIFPFLEIFREYPLLVTAYADLPRNKRISDWVKEEKNIFAAFSVRKGEYNTMLFEFHKNIWSYQIWRENQVKKRKVPPREERTPTNALYFPNRSLEKFAPHIGVRLIENNFKKSNGKIEVDGCVIDEISLDILKCLLYGEGIRVNESYLAKKLKVHRKTVIRRIKKMREGGIIGKPVCRFPTFFAPPGYLLIFSLVEVRKFKKKFIRDIIDDPHVSMAYRISEGRYNLLLFEAHETFHHYLRWESEYESKYHGLLGSIDNTLFAPKMALSIDLEKVTLGAIENRLKEVV